MKIYAANVTVKNEIVRLRRTDPVFCLNIQSLASQEPWLLLTISRGRVQVTLAAGVVDDNAVEATALFAAPAGVEQLSPDASE